MGLGDDSSLTSNPLMMMMMMGQGGAGMANNPLLMMSLLGDDKEFTIPSKSDLEAKCDGAADETACVGHIDALYSPFDDSPIEPSDQAAFDYFEALFETKDSMSDLLPLMMMNGGGDMSQMLPLLMMEGDSSDSLLPLMMMSGRW